MTHLIFTSGVSASVTHQVFKQWLDMYLPDLPSGLRFEVYSNESREQVIKADEQLSDQHFCYLLNYLKYPVDIEYKPQLYAYLNTWDKKTFPKIHVGKQIMLFIPDTDTDYDNVYWVDRWGMVYKTGFGGKTHEMADTPMIYRERDFQPADWPTPQSWQTS